MPHTTSEKQFEHYCAHLGYEIDSIPPDPSPQPKRRPDYLVRTPSHEVIVEVKEIQPNPQDHAIVRKDKSAYWKNPGERLSKLLNDARGQLRYCNSVDLPGFLIVFDNRLVSDNYPLYQNYYFGDLDVSTAMYGQWQVVVTIDRDTGETISHKEEIGGRRTLREDQGTELSVLGIMSLQRDSTIPTMRYYYSYFATHPMSPLEFGGPDDRHFVNRKTDKNAQISWEEVSPKDL